MTSISYVGYSIAEDYLFTNIGGKNQQNFTPAEKLKLAPLKTEAVLLVAGRKIKSITVEIEEIEIGSQESLKYLDIYIDKHEDDST